MILNKWISVKFLRLNKQKDSDQTKHDNRASNPAATTSRNKATISVAIGPECPRPEQQLPTYLLPAFNSAPSEKATKHQNQFIRRPGFSPM